MSYYTHMGEYQAFEKLDPNILNRFKYTEYRNPLIASVAFNIEHLDIMKITQTCVSKGILKIDHKFEEVIIALKNAQKTHDPYSVDKNRSAHHDSLDALMIAFHLYETLGLGLLRISMF